MHILEGPAGAGNVFGIYKPGLVPAGRWIIAEQGEYSNGGYGPSTVDGVAYTSLSKAEAKLAGLTAPPDDPR